MKINYNKKDEKALKFSTIGKSNRVIFNYWNISILLLFILACYYYGIILTTVFTFNILAFIFFIYKVCSIVIGYRNDQDPEKMVELSEDLPTYCILLPMRNEPLAVSKELFKSLDKINYPKSKLDIVILIDEDDDFLDHYSALNLPNHYRLEIAEDCFPKTKPKVCNMGLYSTDAEYIVIYDAEDKPDPNQLLKVLYKFKNKAVECVQCQLHYMNENPSMISRFFNLEYLLHWRIMSWGIKRMQGKIAVIPLGGTSQHLRTSTLKQLGGWDSYNVTEDCDLGIKLSRMGKSIVLSESTTVEFAVDKVWAWIKQRTRWQMGFIMTYMNHSKDLISLIKDLGIYRFIHFLILTIGSVLNPLIALPLFLIYFSYYAFGWFSIAAEYSGVFALGWITLIGNILLITISGIVASFRYDNSRYILVAIISYLYHLLSIVSAYRAVWKYIFDPYTWEKTNRTDLE